MRLKESATDIQTMWSITFPDTYGLVQYKPEHQSTAFQLGSAELQYLASEFKFKAQEVDVAIAGMSPVPLS